jgi:guanylate kinase
LNPSESIVRDGDAFIAHLRGRRRPRVFIVSGPSGVGKDAIIDRLKESEVDTHFAITATTREKRANETAGIHYYFLTQDEFAEWETSGKFLEHAQVYQYRYGVPRDPVAAALARGQDVIIKIDVQGAAAIRSLIPESIGIFLAPESMESLYSRLSARKTDNEERLARRFAEAEVELERAHEFDYIVFNETNGIMRALDDIRAILSTVRAETKQADVSI